MHVCMSTMEVFACLLACFGDEGFFLITIYFDFIHVGVLPMCMHGHHICAVSMETRRGC